MALSKTVTTVHGFEAVNAYHRVENVVMIRKDKIDFNVRSYKKKGLPAFSDYFYQCAYDLTGANPIAQAYAHLKATEEFSDAEDC